MHALMLALAVAAAPALDASRFDYECTTEFRMHPDLPWHPSRRRYHIDLEAGRWCTEECSTNMPVVGTNANWYFLRQDFREGELDDYARERINRHTGELTVIDIRPLLLHFMEVRGHCERAEFTPFPEGSRELDPRRSGSNE